MVLDYVIYRFQKMEKDLERWKEEESLIWGGKMLSSRILDTKPILAHHQQLM